MDSRPTGYYLDGHTPIPTDDLAMLARTFRGDRHVADEMIGDTRVSTVFLGIDHQFGDGPPLLFETMVFSSNQDLDEYCDRYATWDQAAAGHQKIVAMVRAGTLLDD